MGIFSETYSLSLAFNREPDLESLKHFPFSYSVKMSETVQLDWYIQSVERCQHFRGD